MSVRVLNIWTVYAVSSLCLFLGIQVVGALPRSVICGHVLSFADHF